LFLLLLLLLLLLCIQRSCWPAAAKCCRAPFHSLTVADCLRLLVVHRRMQGYETAVKEDQQ
jgi:hypothetical protein